MGGVQLTQLYTLLVLNIICLFFKLSSADLRRCLDKNDNKIELCFNGEDYVHPLPAVLDTWLYLNKIIKIDGDGNSISIHMELITFWRDPGLSLSNGSVIE